MRHEKQYRDPSAYKALASDDPHLSQVVCLTNGLGLLVVIVVSFFAGLALLISPLIIFVKGLPDFEINDSLSPYTEGDYI